MSKKILVIDDDPVTNKLVQSRLAEKGFEVVVAFDGDEGLSMVDRTNPALIILDVEMPRMNGFTFITTLRSMSSYKQLPVIVLTSHKENQPIFGLQGVKGYLIKPLDFNVLYEKVTSCIGLPDSPN